MRTLRSNRNPKSNEANAGQTMSHSSLLQAMDVVSRYGAILESTSSLVLGVPESALPITKQNIESSILLLIKAFKDPELINRLRSNTDFAKYSSLLTDPGVQASLVVGLLFLANFVVDEEAELCVRRALHLSNAAEMADKREETLAQARRLYGDRLQLIVSQPLSEVESAKLQQTQAKILKEVERLQAHFK